MQHFTIYRDKLYQYVRDDRLNQLVSVSLCPKPSLRILLAKYPTWTLVQVPNTSVYLPNGQVQKNATTSILHFKQFRFYVAHYAPEIVRRLWRWLCKFSVKFTMDEFQQVSIFVDKELFIGKTVLHYGALQHKFRDPHLMLEWGVIRDQWPQNENHR